MAHFAQLDNLNNVIQVIVVHNDETHDENGIESEEKGIQFCKSIYGEHTNWVQTSYNASFRKNYAGYGFKYDVARDAFIAPQPFLSWTLNQETFQWEAPVSYPTDGKYYFWDESILNWVEVPALDTPTV